MRLPAPIVAKLNKAINEALQGDALKSVLQKLGAEAAVSTPEQFNMQIAAELKKWKDIAAAAKLSID